MNAAGHSGTTQSAENASLLEKERENFHRQILSSVSHDLKTPLASIIGSLEICERMKDKLPPEKHAMLIQVALQEGYRLDNFITNILDMAKLENGMVKPKPENFEVGSLVKDCILRLSNQLRECTVEHVAAPPLPVCTDQVLLCRAICVVLDNAVKYGGNPKHIKIEVGVVDKVGFIKIKDNGNGIPEAQFESVFSKYTRFAKEDQQNAGTGLGLAIGRAIMNLLGGDVKLANHIEGGSEFTLSFPAA